MNGFLKCLVIITVFAQVGYSQVPMTAADVVYNMAQLYARAHSYRDTGQVKQKTGRTVAFSTYFQRPTFFKFEYFSSAPLGLIVRQREHLVLWRTTESAVQMWWTIKPRVQIMTMDRAISAVTGVSATSSHNIPGLLMPEEVSGFSLASDWTDSTLPSEEPVDGHLCYKVSGHYASTRPSEPLSVWIDKETFLIRKIVNNLATVTYSPQLNVPMETGAFQFDPKRKR